MAQVTDDQAIQAGRDARACFESEAFKAACKVIRDGWKMAWESEEDWREREKLWEKQNALSKVIVELYATAANGAAIESRMKREREEKDARERAKRGAVTR